VVQNLSARGRKTEKNKEKVLPQKVQILYTSKDFIHGKFTYQIAGKLKKPQYRIYQEHYILVYP
jgi:hypothetical protein